MKRKTNKSLMEHEGSLQELQYLRRCTELDTAKILALDLQSIAIRHELEQKRRGFRLMAELAVTLGQDTDYESIFISVSKRINAALNMQRTAVLVPEGEGLFKPVVLQGYPVEETEHILARRVAVVKELLDPLTPVLITGEDPPSAFSSLRQDLALPYLISSPVILHDEVVALLITGRLVEQHPFLTRLGSGDVETVRTVSAYLAAMLAGRRMAEAEKRTQIMLDAMPMCCNFWDEQYNSVDCNEEAVRLFNLANKQEYLDKFFDLSPKVQPDGRLSKEAAQEWIRQAFDSGYARFEWIHQRLDGEPIPAEITLVRVRRGEKYIVAGYTRDLREQKAMLAEMHKTEDELRLASELAKKSAKAKSEFLANMSHEIRTPMNAILGMTHLLAGTQMTDKQRNLVQNAEFSANLLLRIINDILDFSKIDAGRMDMESIEFSLHEVLRHLTDIIREQAQGKPIEFAIAVAPEVPDLLVGDPLRLEQILLNLAGNAIKFTARGKVSVDIALTRILDGKAQIQFDVRDSGIGMTPDQVSGLFTPFTQADASTTRRYGGTGLGLAISKSLVELMHGQIWCRSTLGKGSEFSFTVQLDLPGGGSSSSTVPGADAALSGASPAQNEDAGGTAKLPLSCGYESLRGLRVLIAEDNDINQIIASELLANKGIFVGLASTGLEALEQLRTNRYDVILMDIQMPEMDGLAATARIRSDPAYKGLPIIAMTAHAMAGDREVSLAGGMDDHLTKPIDPDKLYTVLQRWDTRRAKRQELDNGQP